MLSLLKQRPLCFILTIFLIISQSTIVFAQATDNDTVSDTLTLDCNSVFGSGTTKLSYTAKLSSEISPYITSSTNDAELVATFNVQTSKNNDNCAFAAIPPSADPRVYFGTGGDLNVIYSNAIPYRSSVDINRPGDRFQNGTYQVSGSDGAESFNLLIGVAVGPLGVSVDVPNGGPVILLGTDDPGKIDIGNVLYMDNLLTRFRGAFTNGASFTLSNFLMRTGTENQAETGAVKISLPVFKAYRNNALELVQSLIQTGELVGGRYLSTSVRYIRGDYLREPEYEFITRRPIIGIDETVEVDVVIRNRSGAVSLAGGTVALDTSTLAPVLFPLGSTTQTFGSIIPNGSRTVTFSFQGFSLGKVNLQATVNGDWSAPVPPQRDFGGPVSLPGGIEVSTTPPPPPPLFSDGFED